MKINQINIKNYRGYYGENTIKFKTDDPKRHINLVIARNDTGKTTLLNAIYWCLYGEEEFYSSKNSNKNIMSNKKIMESGRDSIIDVEVSILFENNEGDYFEISRKRVFKRVYNEDNPQHIIQKGIDIFDGQKFNEKKTGYSRITNLDSFIQSKMPKGISSFFLLDGEQLKTIFTSNINFEIKKSIEKVANIGAIDKVEKSLSLLGKIYSQNISPEDSDYSEHLDIQNSAREKLETNEIKLNNIENTLNEKKLIYEDILNFLQKNSEERISDLSNEESTLRMNNEEINKNIIDMKTELGKKSIKVFLIKTLRKNISYTREELETVMEGGNFPPSIDPGQISQLLRRGECICGSLIKKNSDSELRLKKLEDVKSYRDQVRIIAEGEYILGGLLKSTEKMKDELRKLKSEIEDKIKILTNNKKRIDQIQIELKDYDLNEVRNKVEEKNMLLRELDRLKFEKINLENEITDCGDLIKDCEKKLDKIKILEEKNIINIERNKICQKLNDSAKKIKLEIMRKIKDNIEKSTAKNFIDLHWKANDYQNVKISDNFSLSILDKYGGELINELSQGASLCFGLAFMTALRNYSGYDVPIIIDSPVGKIDEGNREKIAKNLPTQLSEKQVIFLVTSSEYSSVFKEFIEKKVANEVYLNYNKETGGIDIEHVNN